MKAICRGLLQALWKSLFWSLACIHPNARVWAGPRWPMTRVGVSSDQWRAVEDTAAIIWSIPPNYVSFDGYFYDNDFPNMSNVVWAGSDLTVDLSSPIYFIPRESRELLRCPERGSVSHCTLTLSNGVGGAEWGAARDPAARPGFIFYCIVQSVQIPIYFIRPYISSIRGSPC